MTADEYRQGLERLTEVQRTQLASHIDAMSTAYGGLRSIDSLVDRFKANPRVEERVIRWLRDALHDPSIMTEHERVNVAAIASAAYAKQGYKASLWALGIAIVSLVVSAVLSLIAICKS
jgi:hypothetical protein